MQRSERQWACAASIYICIYIYIYIYIYIHIHIHIYIYIKYYLSMKLPWNFNVHPAQRNMNHHFVYVSAWTSIVYNCSIVASICRSFVSRYKFFFFTFFFFLFQTEKHVRSNSECFIQWYRTTKKEKKRKKTRIKTTWKIRNWTQKKRKKKEKKYSFERLTVVFASTAMQ